MSEVKRYTKKRTRAQIEQGKPGSEFVLASDYDALASECERVRAANLDCVDHFNQAMAARDAALAELAALKGGQEWPDDEIVSAWKWCEENGGTPAEFLSYSLLTKRARLLGRPLTWREAIELTHATTDMPDEQRDKLLAMDAAQPAQASAWVPVSESLPADRRDVMLYCADTKEHFVGFSKGGGLFQFARDGNGISIVCRPSHWRYIEDSDAPTPGASDGKGGAN